MEFLQVTSCRPKVLSDDGTADVDGALPAVWGDRLLEKRESAGTEEWIGIGIEIGGRGALSFLLLPFEWKVWDVGLRRL